MKINDVENIMKTQGFDAVPFSEYVTCLKRVHDDCLKCQHCYLTALELKPSDYKNALFLAQYGIDNYSESWFDSWRAYGIMGTICEKQSDYINAKFYYIEAFNAVCNVVCDDPKMESYCNNLSVELLRVEMHISRFKYTRDLETYYKSAMKTDILHRSFRKTRFYISLAEIILFTHSKDLTKAQQARQEAYSALYGETENGFDKIMKKHRYKDEARPTEEAMRFLRKVGKLYWFINRMKNMGRNN